MKKSRNTTSDLEQSATPKSATGLCLMCEGLPTPCAIYIYIYIYIYTHTHTYIGVYIYVCIYYIYTGASHPHAVQGDDLPIIPDSHFIFVTVTLSDCENSTVSWNKRAINGYEVD